jgi:hypothetical protein
MKTMFALTIALLPFAALAQEAAPPDPLSGWSGIWGLDPDASSAALARDGWQFMALTGLSWPDGRQAVVTLWRSQIGDFARCVDYFDSDMQQAGGKCERSGTGL